MPLPVAAAARAAGAAGNVTATALGLSMGKSDMDLTRDLFKLQMRQAKRLWTADWAEASVRHGESIMQSAQQHAEAQAMAMASYYQAEKLASQSIKLTRDQDSRSYEMAWRSEVRESLRDELGNQYNRFNIVMLCDTVCLGCVFSLVAEGTLPEDTDQLMINLYVAALGVSITLFSVSLWLAVIVVRRLHEHTAAVLERKLFFQSEDLQKRWQYQLQYNLPTGPNEMYLMHQAYEKWLQRYLHPIGSASIHMMTLGVVAMFCTAGLLTHNRYAVEYNSTTAGYIFWSMVIVTSLTVLCTKFAEDRKERRKQGVYDISWQDRATAEDSGPFAKITRAAKELFTGKAVELADTERMEYLLKEEEEQRNFCNKTESLHSRVGRLRKESIKRAKIRTEILQLLTTAAEELDALPEELTSRLNKLLHDIDEADRKTADLVTIHEEMDTTLKIRGSSRSGWSRLPLDASPQSPISPHPTDAQRIPVSLGALRRKLGEASLSTLIRIKNLSNEPLRLKSGVQLKEGKYVKSLNTIDENNHSVCYHLYPSTEIPPRSEIVIAARNTGGWIPTSNVDGEVVYTNKDESWFFRIKFANHLLLSSRNCHVKAIHVESEQGHDYEEDLLDDKFWSIEKKELDIKANNEVQVVINAVNGKPGRRALKSHRESQRSIKSGFLYKNNSFGLKLQWYQTWVELSPSFISYAESPSSMNATKISFQDIISVDPSSDIVKKNVFEVRTKNGDGHVHKFSAASAEERQEWIQIINQVRSNWMSEYQNILNLSHQNSMTNSDTTRQSVFEDGFECVHEDTGRYSVLQM
ncbi:PH domain containing protein [Nitzschia inconspicua]|uniref:PH domain containing protein n=1 Tax=Nitzschia inconspicua TaxID=303405 RepID=A0A9K3LIM5_9STRA|nr:PH domain containing protein [Nitzschia inconspicua]